MTAGLALFDLLGSAAVAFGLALGAALLARRLLRLEDGRLAVALLAAPLVKAAAVALRGVPAESFLWARLAGAARDQGTFQVGVGVSPLGPLVNLGFGALVGTTNHPQSLADGLATAWTRRGGDPWVPAGVGLLLATATLTGLGGWIVRRLRAARRAAALVREARVVELRPLGPRRVRILRGSGGAAAGVPCAGGLLRPWVWLPADAWDALAPEEREAVIAHELAHLRWLDGAVLGGVGALRAAFAFVPGTGRLARRVGLAVELAADQAAARATSPTALAAALVRVAELACRTVAPAEALALLTPRSALGQRVSRLLGPPRRQPTPRPLARAWRAVAVALVVAGVVRATFFGYG
jgi:hypothetical protein